MIQGRHHRPPPRASTTRDVTATRKPSRSFFFLLSFEFLSSATGMFSLWVDAHKIRTCLLVILFALRRPPFSTARSSPPSALALRCRPGGPDNAVCSLSSRASSFEAPALDLAGGGCAPGLGALLRLGLLRSHSSTSVRLLPPSALLPRLPSCYCVLSFYLAISFYVFRCHKHHTSASTQPKPPSSPSCFSHRRS